MAPRRDDNTSCFLLDRREDTRGSKYNGSTPGGWTSLDEKSRGCEAEQTATKKHFLQTPLNIFVPFLSLSVHPVRLAGALQIENSEETDQGKYECVATNSQGVRYSSPANLYVRGRTWTQNARAHAHNRHKDKHAESPTVKGALAFLNTAIYFFHNCSLKNEYY